MRILVVDDTKSSQVLTCSLLSKMGHEPVAADNGEEAIELYKSESPDLILMDVMMPRIDGYETTRRIRTIGGQDGWIPVIFLSGRVADEDVEKGIEAGGDDYLTKPISHVVLRAKLKAMERITVMRNDLVDLASKLEVANAALAELSSRDGLTGIANRRSFDVTLGNEWKRGAHTGGALGLLLLDVDFFKKYNDTYGHQDGDSCLKKVAEAISSAAPRAGDYVARYGGEEFAVILPEATRDGLERVAERVRESVAARMIPHESSEVADHVTVSIGATLAVPVREVAPFVLVRQADEALYAAKRSGRNRVELQELVDPVSMLQHAEN